MLCKNSMRARIGFATTMCTVLCCGLWIAAWSNPNCTAADWNQWRGPGRDGVAPDSPPLIATLPETGLQPVWVSADTIPGGNQGGWASPVVADGRVYVFSHTKQQLRDPGEKKFPWLPPEKRGGMNDAEYAEYERNRRDEDEARSKAFDFRETLICLDAATGKTLWKNEQPSAYTRFSQSGSPAVVEGRVLVLGAGLQARCFDAATGELLWTRRLPGEFRDEYMQSSFAVSDGIGLVLAGRLIALDVQSGEVLWQGDSRATSGTDTSPVLWRDAAGTIVIVNVAGEQTAAFDLASGKELWRVQSEAQNSTPVIAGNQLLTYGSSRKKGLRCYRISRADAELSWKYTGAADPGSSPVVVGDHVFVQGERRFACVDLANGEERWSTTLAASNPRYASLVAADNKVFYAFENMFCFAAEPAECRPLMNAKIDNAGLLIEEAAVRRRLNLDELESTVEGQKQAARLLRERFDDNGLLACASPAIADGRLYLRLQKRIICYDLTAAK